MIERADRTSKYWLNFVQQATDEGETAARNGAPFSANPYIDAGEENSLFDAWARAYLCVSPPKETVMAFGNLRIGARFFLKGLIENPSAELSAGPWEKISPRKAVHVETGLPHLISSLKVHVVGIDPFETADRGKSEQIAEWLQSLGCYDVVPCTVVIGESSFAACAYKQDRTPPEGAPNQSPYTMEAIYCLGAYPPSHDREKQCYTRADDSREWYLGSHIDWKGYRRLTAEQRERFHPFGATFLLCPWNVPDGSLIDSHEEKPYRRVPLAVQRFD